MTITRHAHRATRAVPARIALGALVLSATTEASAEGERTPMMGAAVVAAHAAEHDADLLGVELEAAWWHARLGFAVEGSMRWGLADETPRIAVLGASARVRIYDCLVPSLLEPRDVELGIELHGIAEHAWWDGQASPGYGLGFAARLRGGGDDNASPLLAESRLFVRVVSSRWDSLDAVARTTAPLDDRDDRQLTVLIGIGASFGVGEPGYLERFAQEPLDLLR